MKCKWKDLQTPDESGWRVVQCMRCGGKARSPHRHDKIHSACRLPGLGDWVAFFMAYVLGIRKERVAELLKWGGLMDKKSGGCGCPERQDWLNEAGWRVTTFCRWLWFCVTGRS